MATEEKMKQGRKEGRKERGEVRKGEGERRKKGREETKGGTREGETKKKRKGRWKGSFSRAVATMSVSQSFAIEATPSTYYPHNACKTMAADCGYVSHGRPTTATKLCPHYNLWRSGC
jgi:hypothetical protein